ncbi:hypothetical protein KZP23_01590 [Echinicola marina]|uniref:hypothetical protein n=1 Tax=Echinicola marina TaxID=2859768 RepID=UPI001CF709BC|nr:hypothetical protein [Echinicola marina]UCS93757.1 hypothetical protein KZP23_01590 [Echinicola marina]
MTFVENILNKLFPKDKETISHRENAKYGPEDKANVQQWMRSAEGKKLFESIYSSYHLEKIGEVSNPEIQIYRSPYANGIAIFYDFPFNSENFYQLFFAFGERMLALGYDRVSIERSVQEKKQGINITEKQYLKPKPTLMADQTEQLFGNVTIEKVLVNHQPQMIKILVTVYSDRLYTKAKSFDSFIEAIFNHPNKHE